MTISNVDVGGIWTYKPEDGRNTAQNFVRRN